MFVSHDSSFEERWFKVSDVESFAILPDGTITLDLRGINYPVKLGPFEDTVIDEIVGLITSEGQKR